MNKVMVRINGSEYPMVGPKSERHMLSVASYVDQEMTKAMEKNPKLSSSVAAILTALNIADVFFECVGKNETFSLSVNMTAPAGKICLVGNPYSDMELDKGTYWKILRNQLTVVGTWNSSFAHDASDDWHYVLNRLEQRKINPSQLISHRYSLEDIAQGFQIMRDKTEDYIKIMAQAD